MNIELTYVSAMAIIMGLMFCLLNEVYAGLSVLAIGLIILFINVIVNKK